LSLSARLAAAATNDASALAALADPDARVRRVALGRLAAGDAEGGAPGTPHREAALSCGAADPDALVRAAAFDAWAAGGDGPLPRLLAGLADAHDLVAEAAALALGARGGEPEVLDALLATLATHPSDLVREAAAASLGEVGDLEAIPALLDAARSDRPPVRRRALLALSVFDDPRAGEAISAAHEARNPAVREIAEQLRERPRPPPLP